MQADFRRKRQEIVFVDHASDFRALQEARNHRIMGLRLRFPLRLQLLRRRLRALRKYTGSGRSELQRLSARDRELSSSLGHGAAEKSNGSANKRRHKSAMFCRGRSIRQGPSTPLGDKPLVDVTTDAMRSPEYVRLQTELLGLSQNSKEIIAEKSTHFVIIDRPDVVIDAISQAVRSVRNNAKLQKAAAPHN